MSTPKGSTPAAKSAAGPKKGDSKQALTKKKPVKPIPGVLKSAKFATAKRKRTYVNAKRVRAAQETKRTPPKRSNGLKRMVRVRQVQKHVKAVHAKKTAKAQKEGKPLPAAYPVSREEKKLKKRAQKRKAEQAEKQVAKKARFAKANAFIAAFGKDQKKAAAAYRAGAKPTKALKDLGLYRLPRQDKTKVAHKKGEKRVLKGTSNPWRPAVPQWGNGSAKKFKALKIAPTKGYKTPFKQVLAKIRAGHKLPLTNQMRKAYAKAAVKAHNEKQEAASKAKKAGKPAKAVHPAEQKRLDKKKKASEKTAAKWAKHLQIVEKNKAKAAAAGVPYKPRQVKLSRKQTFRKFKKISVFNLDKMEQSYKKRYRKSKAVLRSSIRPGKILIILKGKYAGRRVVCLKRLHSSKDLLVTGPFQVNGVPLYRINPSFVIATSARLNVAKVPGLKSGKYLKDSLFYIRRKTGNKKQIGTPKEGHTEVNFFAKEKPRKRALNLHKTWIQKRTDKPLLEIIKKHPVMKAYLQASFSLSDKDAPHRMRF